MTAAAVPTVTTQAPFPTPLPDGWAVVELGRCCRSVVDGDWVETKDQGGNDYRLLQVSNIGTGEFRETGNFRYVTQETFQRLRCTEIRPGNVLVARMPDPVGRAWYVHHLSDPAIAAVDIAIVDTDPGVLDARYLAYYLNSPFNLAHAAVRSSGTTRARITRRDLQRFPVPLPPLGTQAQIAAVLTSFDELIENNRRRIKILEEMARLIYREWFVHFRFPGHEGVEFVDTELGRVPVGWDVASFAELADFVNGFAFKPGEHWQDNGLPIVKIKELKNGVTSNTPRYHGQDIDEKYFIDTGDVLFSWSADLDAYVWSEGPALLNQHLFVVHPYDVSSLFIFQSLRSRMDEFRSRAQGTTMRHIKRSALKGVKAIVPDAEARALFDETVRPVLDLQLNLRAQNRILGEARDLLLPRLVSGELDVSELDLDLELAG